jgi:hypothetical protein
MAGAQRAVERSSSSRDLFLVWARGTAATTIEPMRPKGPAVVGAVVVGGASVVVGASAVVVGGAVVGRGGRWMAAVRVVTPSLA